MLKRIVVRSLGAVMVMLVVQSSIAFACSCLAPDQSTLDAADVVFFGEVVAVKPPSAGCGGGLSSADPNTITFEVIDADRGVAAGDDIQLESAMDSASCGIDAAEGETWLIYATNGSVSLCSGSIRTDENPGFLLSDRYDTTTDATY